jgi:hypothetical protein
MKSQAIEADPVVLATVLQRETCVCAHMSNVNGFFFGGGGGSEVAENGDTRYSVYFFLEVVRSSR